MPVEQLRTGINPAKGLTGDNVRIWPLTSIRPLLLCFLALILVFVIAFPVERLLFVFPRQRSPVDFILRRLKN